METEEEVGLDYPKELDDLGLLDPNNQNNAEAFAADYRFTQWKLRKALTCTDDPKLILELQKALMASHIQV